MIRITPERLSRAAIVYVRQSTAHQVTNNLESQRRQYGLVERARQLGWNEVRVIDDDLGRSGGGIERPGFEKLLAAICEGCVGAVLSIEASRLARNGREASRLRSGPTGAALHLGKFAPRTLQSVTRSFPGLKATIVAPARSMRRAVDRNELVVLDKRPDTIRAVAMLDEYAIVFVDRGARRRQPGLRPGRPNSVVQRSPDLNRTCA